MERDVRMAEDNRVRIRTCRRLQSSTCRLGVIDDRQVLHRLIQHEPFGLFAGLLGGSRVFDGRESWSCAHWLAEPGPKACDPHNER